MFKSPADGNPDAKVRAAQHLPGNRLLMKRARRIQVGVVNSGKGMTKMDERKRQTFKDWAE